MSRRCSRMFDIGNGPVKISGKPSTVGTPSFYWFGADHANCFLNFLRSPVSPEVNRGSMGADAGGHSGVGHRPVEDEHGGPGAGDDSRQPVSAQRIDQGHRLRVDAAAELLMELVTGGFEER